VAIDYGPALTETRHLVIMGAGCVFEAEANRDLHPRVPLVGVNADINTGPGDRVTLLSGHSVDVTTISGSTNHDLRLLGPAWTDPGCHARYLVRFNSAPAGSGVSSEKTGEA
jgi:hypothetical protein